MDKKEYERLLKLVEQVAVLKFYLQSAIDFAASGRAPYPEIVDLWRTALEKIERQGS